MKLTLIAVDQEYDLVSRRTIVGPAQKLTNDESLRTIWAMLNNKGLSVCPAPTRQDAQSAEDYGAP